MDTLDDSDIPDYFLDTTWLDDTMPDIPEPTPEEQDMVKRIVAYAVAHQKAKQKQRRKQEDSAGGPSQKISIRLPRPLLSLLKEHAALAGMPYQTYIKTMLHDVAMKQSAKLASTDPDH